MRPEGSRKQHASQPRRSPGAGAPARAERYSRERYVAQQGVQRGASAAPSRQAQAHRAKPVNPRTLLILAAVAAVLLAVIIVRFIAFGGTASEYGAVKAQIDEQNTQMAQLEESSAGLQEQIDSMQPLIDQYNATKK